MPSFLTGSAQGGIGGLPISIGGGGGNSKVLPMTGDSDRKVNQIDDLDGLVSHRSPRATVDKDSPSAKLVVPPA